MATRGPAARAGRRSRLLSGLQRAVHLRRTVRQGVRRPADQARPRQGAGAAEGERATTARRSSCCTRPTSPRPTSSSRSPSSSSSAPVSRSSCSRWTGTRWSSRRARKEPPAQGGWNIFFTTNPTVDVDNPGTSNFAAASCEKAWFGWPCDRRSRSCAPNSSTETDPAKRQALGHAISDRVMEQGVYVPVGQVRGFGAYRRTASTAGCPARSRWCGTSAGSKLTANDSLPRLRGGVSVLR